MNTTHVGNDINLYSPYSEPANVVTPMFEMTVDLNMLEHLGINLYSNIAAVLTEVLAKASGVERYPLTVADTLKESNDAE